MQAEVGPAPPGQNLELKITALNVALPPIPTTLVEDEVGEPVQLAAKASFPNGETIIVGNLDQPTDPNLLGWRVIGPAAEVTITNSESGKEVPIAHRPATVTLPFIAALLTPGTLPSAIFIGRLDHSTGRWTKLNRCHVVGEETEVTCISDTLGTVFGVFAETGLWRDLDSTTRYYAATNTYLRGAFLRFFNETGGPKRHGFPRTNIFETRTGQSQWFQRSRFEVDTDIYLAPLGDEYVLALGLGWSLDSAYQCQQQNYPKPDAGKLAQSDRIGSLTGLLGDELLRTMLLAVTDQPISGVTPHRFFTQRAFCMSGLALLFYEANGNEASFGFPISPEFRDDSTGMQVQYVENARLEFHTIEGGGTRIVLGLVGDDLLRHQGRLR